MTLDLTETAPAKPAALDPNQPLKCMVCGGDMSLTRAHNSKKATCGPECHKVLKQYRTAVAHNRQCATCHRPASLGERDDYKKWRRERGKLQAHGKLPTTGEWTREQLLVESEAMLQEIRQTFAEPDGTKVMDMTRLDNLLKKVSKVTRQIQAKEE